MAHRRRLNPAHDPLEASASVIEYELDRIHAPGGPAGGRAAATDELGELRAQRGMHIVHEPCGDAATFTRRKTQSRVRRDDELHATAKNLTIAAGMRPTRAKKSSTSPCSRTSARLAGCVLREGSSHGCLFAHAHTPSQRSDFSQDLETKNR